MINVLSQYFFAICCLKKNPQDLPASREVLILILLGYVISSILLALSTRTVDIAAASGLIQAMLLAILCYVLLLMRSVPERWLQTTNALYGIGIIFNIAAMPLFFWLTIIGDNNPFILLLFLIVIFLAVWNISVMAHIMRHALSSSFALGVLAALFYVGVIMITINSLFPQKI